MKAWDGARRGLLQGGHPLTVVSLLAAGSAACPDSLMDEWRGLVLRPAAAGCVPPAFLPHTRTHIQPMASCSAGNRVAAAMGPGASLYGCVAAVVLIGLTGGLTPTKGLDCAEQAVVDSTTWVQNSAGPCWALQCCWTGLWSATLRCGQQGCMTLGRA
jgi:hypothetical protein